MDGSDDEEHNDESPKGSHYESFFNFLIGKKTNAEDDSNTRRLISRASLMVIVILLIGLMLGFKFEGKLAWFPIVLIAWATYFFVFIVIAIPFLTSKTFYPNPIRLSLDAIISISLTVLSFAYMYNTYGIVPPKGQDGYSQWDAVYFSAVTFSTLGFGDFSPTAKIRLVAAFQAIIGNLHLGVIVAAAFLAVSRPTKE